MPGGATSPAATMGRGNSTPGPDPEPSMSAVSHAESRGAARAGGWSLIAAAIGFMAVFSYLAAAMRDHPPARAAPRDSAWESALMLGSGSGPGVEFPRPIVAAGLVAPPG